MTGLELVITRIFDSPVENVWKAWNDPGILMQWWGPKTFTSPFCKVDFRLGGRYLNCMRSPEGRDYWSTGEYREIVPYKKIVYSDNFSDENGNIVQPSFYDLPGEWPEELLVTVEFEENDKRTKMTLHHAGMPSGKMSEMAEQGWNESFDKLAESLKKLIGEYL
jgi:uncharacterized protein YndB with AHSA1/START domain